MLKQYFLELEVGMSFVMKNGNIVVGSIYNNPLNKEPIKLEITEFNSDDYHLTLHYNNVLIQYFFENYEFTKVGE